MPHPDLEALFLAHLPDVERILNALGRRHALGRDEADEFASWAKLRIIENDYAVLAKFRGESSLSTYLTVCLAMLFREYRVAERGRWRPSAEARRRGDVAMRLERLVRRDRMAITEAGELLRTSGETTLSNADLARLLAAIPERGALRPVESGVEFREPAADFGADDVVLNEERDAESEATKQALHSAIEALPDEDQLIVRMRFFEDLSVADIARGLAIPQKPLYRRLERAMKAIRSRLEHAGVSADRARGLIGEISST